MDSRFQKEVSASLSRKVNIKKEPIAAKDMINDHMIANEFQAEFVTNTPANENQLHIIVIKITDVKIKCGELYKTREML